jgi:hypothetical protein
MPGPILTTASRIQCPHGGQAVLQTKNTHTSAGATALLETDIHTVTGCTFTVGTKYSPCLTIEWSAGAGAVTIDGTAVLVKSSIGKCKNDGGLVQGIAVITLTQQKASAR